MKGKKKPKGSGAGTAKVDTRGGRAGVGEELFPLSAWISSNNMAMEEDSSLNRTQAKPY